MRPLPYSAINVVRHGDCVRLMRRMDSNSIDFVLTDPPYLVRYRDRLGRTIINDDDGRWLRPAFSEIARLMKPGTFCVSFYGWNAIQSFADAWTASGLRIVGHLVFAKPYASSAGYLRYSHESAYLLAKGRARLPQDAISDLRNDWRYTGNRLHPTQKPVEALRPLIEVFCPQGGVVLDPFCGSGSTLVAAKDLQRSFIGIELDYRHIRTVRARLDKIRPG